MILNQTSSMPVVKGALRSTFRKITKKKKTIKNIMGVFVVYLYKNVEEDQKYLEAGGFKELVDWWVKWQTFISLFFKARKKVARKFFQRENCVAVNTY